MKIIKSILVFVLLFGSFAEAQIQVSGRVDHTDPFFPYGTDDYGNIFLTVSGGTSPYTYKWVPGNTTIKDKTTIGRDYYTVRVKDNAGDSVFYFYNLGYKTDWINHFGTIFRHDSVISDEASGFVNRCALSKNTLPGSTNGWVEYVHETAAIPYVIGFLDSTSVASLPTGNDFDFSFHVTWGNNLYAFVAGSFHWLGTVNEGDVITVERVGSVFYLKVNSSVVYTDAALPHKRLKVKAQILDDPLVNIGVSFKDTSTIDRLRSMNAYVDHIKPDGLDTEGNIMLDIKTGDPAFTYTWNPGSINLKNLTHAAANSYTVKVKDSRLDSIIYYYNLGYKTKWKNFYGTGTFFRNDTIFADHASTPSGNASALSINELKKNTDGWMETVIQDFASPYVIGLLDSASTASQGTHNDFDFAFHETYDRNMYAWDGSSFYWLGEAQTGDVIRLERIGSTFYLKRNNSSLFSSSALAHKRLKIKVTINDDHHLQNIGASFADSTSSNTLNVRAYVDHLQLHGADTMGNIKLTISGGKSPYTYSWTPGGSTSRDKLNVNKNSFTVKVKDANNDSLTYYYNLGYKTDWKDFYGSGTHFTNDTLYADDASTPIGSSTALSKNELRPSTNGWTEMVLEEFGSPIMFGFLDSASVSSNGDHYDFDFAFHETTSSAMYAFDGSSFTYLGTGKAGDVVKLERSSSTFYLKINNATVFTSSALAHKRLKLKALINDDFHLENIGTSFTPSLVVDYNKGDIVSDDEPNSGYIFLMPKYGLPPYRYLWSNSSTASSLADLSVGNYSVIVSDSLRDTVRISFTIGKEVKLSRLNNISRSEGAFIKNDYDKPGVANTNVYVPGSTDGYYEIRLADTLTNFNFLFREIDTTLQSQPQPITIVKTKTVHIAWTALPARGTDAYNLINFTDTVTTRDSAWVIQKEFFADTCKFLSTCSRQTYSGIHFDYGRVYVLSNGYTIKKGTKVGNDVTIKLSLEGSDFKVRQNNTLIETNSFTHTNPLIGDFILGGPRTPVTFFSAPHTFPNIIKYYCLPCSNDNNRNWIQTTVYDDYGNTIAEGREYFDYLGRSTQSQVRNISENNILAVQTLYDAYGRAVLGTLPAPINQTCFCYKTNFVNNSTGALYTYNDFDIPNYTTNSSVVTAGEVDDPKAVGTSTASTLGWYYSNLNTLEKYVAIGSTPYSRIQYSKVDPSSVLRASQPGDKLNSGSGHESYSISMETEGELATVFGAGQGWRVDQINNFSSTDPCEINQVKPLPLMNTAPMSLKSIGIDENGIEAVSFTDLHGNLIASCLAGKVNGSNVKTQTVKTWISWTDETKRYADIHLPDGCETSFALEFPWGTPSGTGVQTPRYSILDLKTNEYVLSANTNPLEHYGNYAGPSLSPGHYRIFLTYMPSGKSGINVVHNLNYYNWTLNYYDYANRLKAIVSPKGFDDSYVYSSSQPGFSTNRYYMDTITSGANVPPYFPVGTTWSMDSTTFINTKSISLTEVPPYGRNNVNFNITFGGRKEPGVGPINAGSTTSDARTTATTTAWNTYTDQDFIMDSSAVKSELDSAQCTNREIYFRVRIALLDAIDTIIPGSIQESVDLKCTVKDCYTDYYFWKPITFNYQKTFDNSDNRDSIPTWKKIKILNFEPIFPTFGDTFVTYAKIVSQLRVTAGIVELISDINQPEHKTSDRYRYNSWGEVLNVASADAGQTDFVYARDGKVKFSQNAKQDASNATANLRKFTYMDYDNDDRPITGGEYDQTTSGSVVNYMFQSYQENEANPNPPTPQVTVHFPLIVNQNNADAYLGQNAKDKVYLKYDSYDANFWAETGLSSANYIQHHLAGMVSYSYNDHKKTWYSYDEQGRVEWVVQKYYNVGITSTASQHICKTYNYKYDWAGNVTEIAYNKENSADRFYHYYEYDLDQRLKRAYTSRNGTTKYLQAKYDFYLHGPLKRIELANKMQALDFVYTINGWMKAINGPEMDKEHDAGQDGYLTNSSNTVYKDIFGMNMDYYLDDYERAGTNIQSYDDSQNGSAFAPDLYNGIVKAHRWQTRTPGSFTGLSYDNQHLMFGYKYDKKYQLLDARFATITSNGTQNQTTPPGSPAILTTALQTDYRTNNLTYDYNGNLLTLTRKAWAASANGVNLDDLTYTYENCGNRLNKAVDAVATNPYNTFGFKPGQSNNNYAYNAVGEQTLSTNDNKKYEYNSFGNITALRDVASGTLLAEYFYDEAGMRVKKTAYLAGGATIKNTWYVRDAGGQIITTFEKTGANSSTDYTIPAEWNVYAGSRVGILDNTGGTETYIYELSDNQGNVRATFKKQAVTTFSTAFEGTGLSENWFNSSFTLDNTLAGGLNKGYSVKTLGPNSVYGAGSKMIPVKYNDAVTVDWKSLYTSGGSPPGGTGMVMQLVDASGNILSNQWIFTQIPTGSGSWQNNSVNYTVPVNFPNMYLLIYPWNQSTTTEWYDDLKVTFTTGNVESPDQLNMATYYPHGSVMPGMNYSSSYAYKYGYQGQFAEMDNESNENFFELRNYDPLLGRFNTTDPYNQYFSPYVSMGNNHPNQVDPDGGFGYSIAAGIAGAFAGVILNDLTDGGASGTPYLERQKNFALIGALAGISAGGGADIGGGLMASAGGDAVEFALKVGAFGGQQIASDANPKPGRWPFKEGKDWTLRFTPLEWLLRNNAKWKAKTYKRTFGAWDEVTNTSRKKKKFRGAVSVHIGPNQSWTQFTSGESTLTWTGDWKLGGGQGPGILTITPRIQPNGSPAVISGRIIITTTTTGIKWKWWKNPHKKPKVK
jgi:RHS repeat-associated protein